MTLKNDLRSEVWDFAVTSWGNVPNGYVVPSPENLTFANTGIHINACVLYADINRSTEMVDSLLDTKAAEYYKAFLKCAAKLIKSNGGEVTAYDGDRVMAIFMGGDQAQRAVQTAFEINFAVQQIINPTFAAIYGNFHRPIKHTVGIDCGQLLAAKVGVRVDSDLVWVGPAANYAAKLNSFPGLEPDFPTRITQRVFDFGPSFTRFAGGPVWEGPYNDLKSVDHYRSDLSVEFT